MRFHGGRQATGRGGFSSVWQEVVRAGDLRKSAAVRIMALTLPDTFSQRKFQLDFSQSDGAGHHNDFRRGGEKYRVISGQAREVAS